MWTRHLDRPLQFQGTTFRSGLEPRSADQSRQLGVTWAYEVPTTDGLAMLHRPADPPRGDYLVSAGLHLYQAQPWLRLPLGWK